MAKKVNKPMRHILKWILSVFMLLGALVYLPSFSSVIFTLLGIVLLPLKPITNWWNQIFPGKKGLKCTIAVLVFVIGCCIAPLTDSTENSIDPIIGTSIVEPTDSTANYTEPNSTTATHSSQEITEPPTESSSEATVPPTESSSEATVPPTEPSSEATVPPTEPSSEATVPSTDTTLPDAASSFSIHYIDVGQADAALVECDGHYMLIDGGNKGDSNVIYAVLKKTGVSKLDIVVGTHAHEDHIGGLPGAFNYTTADLTLCPVTNYDSNAFDDFARYAQQNGNGITVPSVGDTYYLGSATVKILGVNGANDTNNSSIVLRIDYGQTTFLFTGDAEREAEQVVLSAGVDLSATVLKVGHHGSDTSTTYPFLREIMPQYAIISVGKGNSYGHPTENTLSRLRDAGVTVFRTDIQGDIYCISDGQNVTITVSRNPNADVFDGLTNPQNTTDSSSEEPTLSTENNQSSGQDYVANTNTKKFHYPHCSSANKIKDSNRWDFHGTREELIDQGYVPCKNCNP